MVNLIPTTVLLHTAGSAEVLTKDIELPCAPFHGMLLVFGTKNGTIGFTIDQKKIDLDLQTFTWDTDAKKFTLRVVTTHNDKNWTERWQKAGFQLRSVL